MPLIPWVPTCQEGGQGEMGLHPLSLTTVDEGSEGLTRCVRKY